VRECWWPGAGSHRFHHITQIEYGPPTHPHTHTPRTHQVRSCPAHASRSAPRGSPSQSDGCLPSWEDPTEDHLCPHHVTDGPSLPANHQSRTALQIENGLTTRLSWHGSSSTELNLTPANQTLGILHSWRSPSITSPLITSGITRN
jgi:hypothetical protein